MEFLAEGTLESSESSRWLLLRLITRLGTCIGLHCVWSLLLLAAAEVASFSSRLVPEVAAGKSKLSNFWSVKAEASLDVVFLGKPLFLDE